MSGPRAQGHGLEHSGKKGRTSHPVRVLRKQITGGAVRQVYRALGSEVTIRVRCEPAPAYQGLTPEHLAHLGLVLALLSPGGRLGELCAELKPSLPNCSAK